MVTAKDYLFVLYNRKTIMTIYTLKVIAIQVAYKVIYLRVCADYDIRIKQFYFFFEQIAIGVQVMQQSFVRYLRSSTLFLTFYKGEWVCIEALFDILLRLIELLNGAQVVRRSVP